MDYPIIFAPLHVNWNFTYQCNFNCEHCYSRTRNLISEMTLSEKKDVAHNLIDSRVFNVNLGGGEPLLSDDCFEIIQMLSSQNICVNLSSNGWNIQPKTVSDLKDTGLYGVAISIDHTNPSIHDSVRRQNGSYESAVEAMRLFVASDIHVMISTTITSHNFDVLEDILQLGEQLGVDSVDFKRLKTMGNAQDRLDLEISEVQRDLLYTKTPIWKKRYPMKINLVYGTKRLPDIDSGCPCGKTSICIMDNGDIAPCVYNTVVIGNALKDSIHDIWCNSPFLKHFRENYECMGLIKEDHHV